MTRQDSVHEIRLGTIRATVWEEDSPDGIQHRVSVYRVLREGDEVRRSTVFTCGDLPLVAEVVDMAHLWICERAALPA